MEQRAAIKFCFKSGKTASETFEMMQKAYGSECLSRSKVFEWFSRFKNGRDSLEDDSRAGRPVTARNDENVNRVRALLDDNRRTSIKNIAGQLGIATGTVHSILHDDLNMRKVCAKFVPHHLTPEQKAQRAHASRNFIEAADMNENFLSNIITGDETWCFQYDPSTKRQSAEWRLSEENRPTKVRATKSKVKTMLIAFFDSRGIVHKEFVPTGQTVTGTFYVEVLTRLIARIRRVRPELYESGEWCLLHDNAPAHSSVIVRQFLAKKSVTILDHPPYSPDLAPADFMLFPKLKFALKGEHFQDVRTIQQNVTAVLNSIPVNDFQKAFQSLYDRSRECVARGGMYVEP